MHDLGMELPSHAFCPNCKQIQAVKAEALTNPDDSGKYLGGDIVCAVCAYIIATLYKRSGSTIKV